MKDQKYVDINKGFTMITGYSRTAAVGKTPSELGLYADPGKYERIKEKIVNQRQVRNFAIDIRSNKGVTRHCLFSADIIEIQQIPHVITITKDITKEVQMEKERQQHLDALKHLVSELTLAEERERRRIAGDIHDHMSQILAMAKITLTSAARSVSEGKTKSELIKVNEWIHEAIQQSRTLTYDLSPPILYDLGLIPALKWNLDNVTQKNRISGKLITSMENLQLNHDQNVLLYRAVNEIITNAVKHSKATGITLEIDHKEDYIYISVTDDGIGFDVREMLSTASKETKFGLFSIRERLELMAGKLEIHSKPGKGTRIILIFPYS
jgi:PAS domain S-box-containing protein